MATIPVSTSGMSRESIPLDIRNPIPALAPSISAASTVVQPELTEVRIPAKMDGSAVGDDDIL